MAKFGGGAVERNKRSKIGFMKKGFGKSINKSAFSFNGKTFFSGPTNFILSVSYFIHQ